ncbi:hypothetical protein BBB56_16030 [Candidatus Pantoea deserta]|uniref:Uncharacterized protein n=1 Tax=Candidatus Pantoea deserta TaxID=1869313 RepID=A0A3N4NP55_9GAMM|nr:hypothetical protein BBB56_16030 [Pantoea deserta]
MQDGFYWVQAGNDPPQVWYYLSQFGWYRPQVSVPVTSAWFKRMSYKIISDRLLPPAHTDEPDNP